MLATAMLVVACGGGGGGNSPAPPVTQPTGGQGISPQLSTKVNFSLNVPAAAASSQSGARHTANNVYVSPNTGSISIQLSSVDGQSFANPPAPTTVDVPSSCIGTTGCTIAINNVPAAPGTDSFIITTYALPSIGSASPPPNVLSVGIINIAVTSSTPTETIGDPTQLSLGGYVESISLSLTPPAGGFRQTVPSSGSLVVMPRDASGAIIVGNVQFATPITLASTGSIGLSIATLAGPQAAPLPVTYSGSGTTGGITATTTDGTGTKVSAQVAASIGTAPSPMPSGPGQVVANPSSLTFASSAAAPQTVNISENNFAGPFTAVSAQPGVATATVAGSTVTVVPVSSGQTSVTITGGAGNSVIVLVTVNFAPITASVPSLSFATATSATQTFTVSQPGFGGPFTVTSSQPNVATASVSGSTVTVTPVSNGQANITVTGGNGLTAVVVVGVAVQPIVPSPATLTFVNTGAAAAQTVSLTQSGNTTFGVSIDNPSIATATLSGSTITVTPLTPGLAHITVTGEPGTNTVIDISVTTSPGTIQ